MKRGSRFNFRRIYHYTCNGCGKKRGTKIYARRIVGLCTLCRRNKVDKNQLKLGILTGETEKFKYNIGDKVKVIASGISGKIIKIGDDQNNKGKSIFKIKGYEEMWFREDELI